MDDLCAMKGLPLLCSGVPDSRCLATFCNVLGNTAQNPKGPVYATELTDRFVSDFPRCSENKLVVSQGKSGWWLVRMRPT
jgi:hypothetical protein